MESITSRMESLSLNSDVKQKLGGYFSRVKISGKYFLLPERNEILVSDVNDKTIVVLKHVQCNESTAVLCTKCMNWPNNIKPGQNIDNIHHHQIGSKKTTRI